MYWVENLETFLAKKEFWWRIWIIRWINKNNGHWEKRDNLESLEKKIKPKIKKRNDFKQRKANKYNKWNVS